MISSAANFAPFTTALPYAAAAPVKGPVTPILKEAPSAAVWDSAAALVSPAAAVVSAAAAAAAGAACCR